MQISLPKKGCGKLAFDKNDIAFISVFSHDLWSAVSLACDRAFQAEPIMKQRVIVSAQNLHNVPQDVGANRLSPNSFLPKEYLEGFGVIDGVIWIFACANSLIQIDLRKKEPQKIVSLSIQTTDSVARVAAERELREELIKYHSSNIVIETR